MPLLQSTVSLSNDNSKRRGLLTGVLPLETAFSQAFLRGILAKTIKSPDILLEQSTKTVGKELNCVTENLIIGTSYSGRHIVYIRR